MAMKYIWNYKNWFDFKYDKAVLLEPLSKLRMLQGKFLEKTALLDIKLETQAQAAVLTEEAVRTAQIEGQKLNVDAVRSSVCVRLGLPHGVVVRDRNVDGLVEVLLDAVQNFDKSLTLTRLNGWQAALFPSGYSGLKKIHVGRLRGKEPMQIVSGPIGNEKIHFEAPPREQMEKEMRLFLKWWHSSFGKMDGILRSAEAHLRFVTIHPYEDGNGRLARTLTDMALAQDEKSRIRFYSLSSQVMRLRKDYYKILEGVQKCQINVTEWFLWFIKCISLAIQDSEHIIGNIFRRVEFWNKYNQVTLSKRQKKVLNRILEAGRYNFKGGLSTRKYVSIAKVSRATAFREIADLLQKGILKKLPGHGRNVHYDIKW